MLEQGHKYDKLTFAGTPLDPQLFLGRNYRVHPSFSGFPTFVQSRPRKSPPLLPAGLEAADKSTLARWSQDNYRFAPYQYRAEKLVLDVRSQTWAPPSTRTRETLMGLRAGHTEAAAIAKGRKPDARQSTHIRDTPLGQSINCETLAVIMGSTLASWNLLDMLPDLEDD